MRGFIFLCINLAWFAGCFASYFFIDKLERGGFFTWQNWHIFTSIAVILSSALLVARLYNQTRIFTYPIPLSFIAYTLILVFNALLAFVTYAVTIIFIYGE